MTISIRSKNTTWFHVISAKKSNTETIGRGAASPLVVKSEQTKKFYDVFLCELPLLQFDLCPQFFSVLLETD